METSDDGLTEKSSEEALANGKLLPQAPTVTIVATTVAYVLLRLFRPRTSGTEERIEALADKGYYMSADSLVTSPDSYARLVPVLAIANVGSPSKRQQEETCLTGPNFTPPHFIFLFQEVAAYVPQTDEACPPRQKVIEIQAKAVADEARPLG